MKINSIQFYKNFNTNFCANKKNYYDVLQSANPKDYPVRVYDEIKKCAQENETLNFYDLNYRLYSPLLKAKNLDEAKALYSEFENILELSQAAKSVPFKDPKIQAMIKGKINEPEGGFSLHILKCLYKLEKDDDYSGDKLRRTAKSLRIPDVGKRYFSRVTFDSPSHKEKMSLSHSGDEYIKNLRKNARERWANPEFREKMAREVYTEEFRQKQRKKSLEIYANNPQISQMLSEMMVKKWQDEKYRAEMDLIMHSESFRQKDSESLKRFYQTHPEALSALSERGKRQWSEEYREKMAPLYQSEEYRALCAKNAIIRNQNPQYREKIRQKVWSNPEFIEASRKASVERWKNQQYREKMTVCMQKTWDNLDELKKRAKIIRDEHPYVNVLFAKIGAQEELSENELIYLKEYYSEFWSEKDTRELYSQMAKKIFSEYGTLKL